MRMLKVIRPETGEDHQIFDRTRQSSSMQFLLSKNADAFFFSLISDEIRQEVVFQNYLCFIR
jgi:hypothetical protein